jgi:hypothetical protein
MTIVDHFFSIRARLEHGNFTGIPQDRNFGGKFSFDPFGTQE